MKIKYAPGKEPPPEPPTFEEIFEEIGKELERLAHNVSEERLHAVESQLRGIVRLAGYRFREKHGQKLTLKEVFEQTKLALVHCKFEIHKESSETVYLQTQAVLSNLKAEGVFNSKGLVEREIPEPPKSDV
jgi:hypothetical protein